MDWTGTGADHAVIWAMKDLKTKFRTSPMVRKRVWKNLSKERLTEVAGTMDWSTKSSPRTKEAMD